MTITEQEIRDLIAEMDQGRQNWINGKGETLKGVDQSPDMTLLGPFGGLGPSTGSMTPEQLAAGQAAVSAANFHGGEGRCEVITTIVEGDLVVLVLIERNAVNFDGFESPRPWILRTTQIFRKNGDRWIRLHRHADPLILTRSFDDTLTLLDAS